MNLCNKKVTFLKLEFEYFQIIFKNSSNHKEEILLIRGTYLKMGGLVDGHRGLDEPDNRHAVPPGVRDGEVPVEHAEQVVQVSGVL